MMMYARTRAGADSCSGSDGRRVRADPRRGAHARARASTAWGICAGVCPCVRAAGTRARHVQCDTWMQQCQRCPRLLTSQDFDEFCLPDSIEQVPNSGRVKVKVCVCVCVSPLHAAHAPRTSLPSPGLRLVSVVDMAVWLPCVWRRHGHERHATKGGPEKGPADTAAGDELPAPRCVQELAVYVPWKEYHKCGACSWPQRLVGRQTALRCPRQHARTDR
jgi:hypothetical protein